MHFVYMKTFALALGKQKMYLQILQLLFSVILGLIADIGVLQGCLVATRNYELDIRYVRKNTIAGILSLLRALACALSGVTQVTFEDIARVLFGFFGGIGVVEICFVTTGLTSI